MGNLLDALQGSFNDDNRIWADALKNISALQAQISSVRSSSDPFVLRTLPLQQRRAVYSVSEIMVLAHINNDLREALVQNGIGHNNDWNCIGNVVNGCSKTQFSSLELSLAAVLGKDVAQIRDDMRFQVSQKDATPIRPSSP